MSNQGSPIVLSILDKEYRVVCGEGEEESLQTSAELLNAHIEEVRNGGKVIGADRITVMAALNLAHTLLSQTDEQNQASKSFYTRIRDLQDQIDTVLENTRQLEL